MCRNHTATPVGSEAAAVEEKTALCFLSTGPPCQVYVFGGYDGQKNHNELLGSSMRQSASPRKAEPQMLRPSSGQKPARICRVGARQKYGIRQKKERTSMAESQSGSCALGKRPRTRFEDLSRSQSESRDGMAWRLLCRLVLQWLPRLYIFDLQSMELGPFHQWRSHPCSQHVPRWRQPTVGGQKPSGRTLTAQDFFSRTQFARSCPRGMGTQQPS